MDKSIIARFDAKRLELEAQFKAKHPESYSDLVTMLVRTMTSEDSFGPLNMDPDRIGVIDHGEGTQVFVIGAKGYQPYEYWVTKCSYGSCPGCDTLQMIRGYGDSPPSDKQAADYMTLALHLVQQMRSIHDAAE